MIDWTTAQNAIHAWAVTGSQLPAAQVIWAAQQAPRPPGQIVVLRLAGVAAVSQDWIHRESAPAPVTPGAEQVLRVQGHRVATLSIQVFGGAPLGASSNLAVLERILGAVGLPSIRRALGLAKVGMLSREPAVIIDGGRGELLEARAATEVRLSLPSELSEFGTTIESVEVANESAGGAVLQVDR